MAQDFDPTNRGILGRNTRRRGDRDPEFSGSLNVDGVDYWLSAWVGEKNGNRFFKLSVKPKAADGARRNHRPADDMPAADEDIPL
jgi:hypothetical protein